MTDHEINEAVLRSLGWDNMKDGREVKWHRTEPNGCLSILESLPDFANDPNAMAQAEDEYYRSL